MQLESLHWKPHELTLLAAPQVASDGPNPAGGWEMITPLRGVIKSRRDGKFTGDQEAASK